MKIGLFLGSFDPIHISHVSVIAQVLNNNIVDRVLVVPVVQNPFKVAQPASFDLRCQMIQVEIDKLNAVFSDKIAIHRGEEEIESPNYSYKILTKIREDNPNDELFIICGTDVIEQIDRWKNFKSDILPYFKYIEIGRNIAYVEDGVFDIDVDGGTINVTRQPNSLYDASSTSVREMCRLGECPIPYVSPEVYSIIINNNLYKA